MARRTRPAGVSGVAVSLAVFGAVLVYSGIRDVSPLTALRTLARGEIPPSRSSGEPYRGPAKAAGPVDISETQVVGGIRVHKAIASNVAELLDAARRAGHNLGGYGYRSNLAQRSLRLLHGYTSDDMPSGAGGRLPVARPGQSRHERGLAIDFTVNGRQLKRSDAAFDWLSTNAARYGLHNLPSEPWHWSTDGK